MKRMHRLAPQCDMLELVPPRRSKMFLKWQELRNKDPPQGVKPKPREHLHIWQKVHRLRELNILEDYYWFYKEWDRINNKFMKRFNKTFPELMMERIHHHRIKMENATILASCILILAEEQSSDPHKWEMTLRKYFWEPTPGVPPKPLWDDGSPNPKPHDSKPLPIPQPDRIGRADHDNPSFAFFTDQWAHVGKKADDWTAWEAFCFKMAALLLLAEPFYPDFTGLLKVAVVPGPAAMISLTYHFFVNQVGEQSTKIILLENVGETVLFYTWERRPMEALVTTPKVHLGNITDCPVFSLLNGTGSIQSGEKKKFIFKFKSDVPGVFLESWAIRIAPRLPIPWTLDPIFFKGVAFSKDHFQKLREKLSRVLYYREMMSGMDEFFVDTLNRAAKASRPTKEIRFAGDYMFSSKAFNFLQKNITMEPPVYYVPSVYQKIEALATIVKAWKPSTTEELVEKLPLGVGESKGSDSQFDIPWEWDGSFSSILKGIEESTMSERIKQHFRREVAYLKELVQIPPRQTMLLHVAVYKMLRDIITHTGDVMEGVPQGFGQPMAETLLHNYYDKYEQERLQKQVDAQARMEHNPEAAEAEMMEMLLEQINLGNPPLNEISLETRLDNQEMLEYCFKWLHILTEMRLYMRVGFNDYEGQIQLEQKHLKQLISSRICELFPLVDETSSWDQFALKRVQQELLHDEHKLCQINNL